MSHHWEIRVYYEDTDLAGIVYHANYLKFTERARSEAVRTVVIDQKALKDEGIVFAVAAMEAKFRTPARYDDLLRVETKLLDLKGVSLRLSQTIFRDQTPIFESFVTLAGLGASGKPVRFPADIRERLAKLGA